MNGVICVDKPFGCTSFSVVAKLRKILKEKKVGHSGTLDPIATGVLPVFIGKATKAISFLQNTDKSYVAGFKLGQLTNTFDITGELICVKKSKVDLKSFRLALEKFKGLIEQVPPKFSAVKINGTPAYKLARKGQDFKLNSRRVNVFEIGCIDFDIETQTGSFFVHCSSGTYIRAICRDLGDYLGVGCVLTSLVRTMACGWSLEKCFTIEEVKELSMAGNLNQYLTSVESIFENFERIQLNFQEKIRFLNGVHIKLSKVAVECQLVTVYFGEEFLGLAKFEKGDLIVKKLFL